MGITETSSRSGTSGTSQSRTESKSSEASSSSKESQGTTCAPEPKDSVSIDRRGVAEDGNTDRVADLSAALWADDPNSDALERIAEITSADHAKYGGQTTDAEGNVITTGVSETEDPLKSDLARMWESAGHNWDGNTETAWSAAYISDVMERAGVDNFQESIRHSEYINGAIEAREAGDESASHWGYRASEHAPQAGDLVCFAREDSGATFDNQLGGQYLSHCDIVTGVRDGFIDTIGGNVGDGVATRSFTTDANGMVNDPVKDWIAVLAPQMLGTH